MGLAHPGAALSHHRRIRRLARRLHLRHPLAEPLGEAVALRSRLDPRRPHERGVHRGEGAAAVRRLVRTNRAHPSRLMTPFTPKSRIPVAVLGATGPVGQSFIRLLADHPWFDVSQLAASERSAGRKYVDATRWIGGSGIPDSVRDVSVLPCDPDEVSAPIVFSALDANVAGDVEAAFAHAGRLVLSNAKNFRMDRDVPLVIPEVNSDHLSLLDVQRANRGWKGGIVTNANCASIMAVMALAPLHEAFGVRRLFIATMQAVSGAGYPGVASLDILGNVVPFISGEEEKIEQETLKLLGELHDGAVRPAAITVSAHTNRVP